MLKNEQIDDNLIHIDLFICEYSLKYIQGGKIMCHIETEGVKG